MNERVNSSGASAMAYHPKAQCVMFRREETDSEKIVRLYLAKIANHSGSGRRNRQLLSLAEKEIASNKSVMVLNIAEIYYNGAPGIAINLDKTITYYVALMEVDDFPSLMDTNHTVGFLNNFLEVHDLCSTSILPDLAAKLDRVAVGEKKFILGVAQLIRGKFFDMDGQFYKAMDTYLDALDLLQDDTPHSNFLKIHCQVRLDVLKCCVDAAGSGKNVTYEVNKIKEDGRNKMSKCIKISNNFMTPARQPENIMRLSFVIPENVNEDDFIKTFWEDFEKFKKKQRDPRENVLKENLRKEKANQVRRRLEAALDMVRSNKFSSWLFEELESCILSVEQLSDTCDFLDMIVEAKCFVDNKKLFLSTHKKKKKIVQATQQVENHPIHINANEEEPDELPPDSQKIKRKNKQVQKEKEKMKAAYSASELSKRREREKLREDFPKLFEFLDTHESNYIIKESQTIPPQKPDVPPVVSKMKLAKRESEFEERAFNLAVEMSLAELD